MSKEMKNKSKKLRNKTIKTYESSVSRIYKPVSKKGMMEIYMIYLNCESQKQYFMCVVVFVIAIEFKFSFKKNIFITHENV